MKRRKFIYAGITVAAGLGAGIAIIQTSHPNWKKHPLLYPFILSGFLNEESLRIIGRSYRALRPGEDSKEKLLDRLLSDTRSIQSERKDTKELAVEIERHAELDFKSEKFLLIKGWLISETEARQCALLSLS
jgi:hypothetical protein